MMTYSYCTILRRLQVNIHAHTVGNINYDEADTILRHKVAGCRRKWQRRKRKQLFRQHTYSPGATTLLFLRECQQSFETTLLPR